MSSPSFVPERGEIWYSDGLSGFYAVRLTNGVAVARGAPRGARACLARRSPIGPRNIGRVRLGYTRRRLRRVPVTPVRSTPPLLPLLRQGQRGPRERRLLAPRPRRARGHHGPRARKPPPAPRLRARALRRAYSAPPRARPRPLPREPREPAPDRRPQGPGALLRGGGPQPAAQPARAPAPPAPSRSVAPRSGATAAP